MSFPTTIDNIAQTPEAAARYGPFAVGNDLYIFNTFFDSGLLTFFLLALKSTDNGATWAEVDTGNHPIITNIDGVTACQSTLDPTQLYVTYIDINSNCVVQVFSPDAWGTVFTDSFFPIQSSVYRESDNSIVLFRISSTPDSQHNIVCFFVFDIGSGTFSATTDLGFSDYSDPTVWNQKVCGAVLRSDGAISVFMQQATQRTLAQSPTVLDFPAGSTDFFVPFDCPVISLLEIWGAGGGGGGNGGANNGGGGGGGYTSVTNLTVTPLADIPISVGAGGLQNNDGGDSSWNGGEFSAGGGKKGVITAGGAGGAGATHSGGKGGDGLGTAGGGGGAAGGSTGNGAAGGDSNGTNRGTGGIGVSPAGSGGAGGQLLFTSVNAIPGAPFAGGGGGASSDGGTHIGQGGTGSDGDIRVTYTPTTNSHPSRMWQQTINADNTLGTLTEITEGTFPIDGGGQTGLVPFDCAAGSGFVVIVFTWVTASGITNMLVGKASNADPLSFTFQTVSIGSTSGIDPAPAVAVRSTNNSVELCYISADDLTAVNYLIRYDTGSGFGAPTTIGTFADAGCRLQTAVLLTLSMGVFGTPTAASALSEAPG